MLLEKGNSSSKDQRPCGNDGPLLPTDKEEAAEEPALEIITEMPELLVLRKPAGLPCHPSKQGPMSSLAGRVRLYLGGSGPVHFVNRLDAETAGIVIVAKDLKTARELRWIWEHRGCRKIYWAIVHGAMKEPGGIIKAPIGRDETSRIVVKGAVRPDGARALTLYKRLKIIERPEGYFTWVHVEPITGRKHQIRIHLAYQGYPIVGDKLYGVVEDAYMAMVEGRLTEGQRRLLIFPCQALLAREVQFKWRGRIFQFRARPEPWFAEFIGPEENFFE